jgi:hypothetical protein
LKVELPQIASVLTPTGGTPASSNIVSQRTEKKQGEERRKGVGGTLSLQFPAMRIPSVPFVLQRRIIGENERAQKFPPFGGHGTTGANCLDQRARYGCGNERHQ